MRVLPAVDLMDGATVQLRGGDPNERLFEDPDPIGVARDWVARGARGLHVVDLNAAIGTGHNRDLVRAILHGTDVPVEVGGGLRTHDDVASTLDRGAARVVVGTTAWTDPAFLDKAVERHPGRVIVALETRNGRISIRGWTATLPIDLDGAIERVRGLALGGVLATCIDVEGSLRGPDTETLARLCDELDVPVVGSGGIADLDHVAATRDAGCTAVVVGTALYTGRLELAEAQEVARDDPQANYP